MKIITETKNVKEYRRKQSNLNHRPQYWEANLFTTVADALPCASLFLKIRMCHQTAFYPWLQCSAGELSGSTVDSAQLQTYLPFSGP